MFENFIRKLRNDTFITLETTPQHSPQFEPIIKKLRDLEINRFVDGFSVTDSPLAKLKYSSILASIKLQNSFYLPVISTMSMRDRNKIGLQSDILGANEFGIRCFLALTGDPATISDQPNTKGVFEGDSTMLLDIIKCFNGGINYAGKEFAIKPEKIYPFSVINSYSKNLSHLQKKMIKKISHGSIGVISQPVFDIENAKSLIELFRSAKSQFSDERNLSELVIGIFPITKLKTAQFIASHVPGIYVPKDWIDELYSASKIGVDEEFKVGLNLSLKLFKDIKKIHPKIHIMTANNFEIAKKVLEESL